MKQAKRCRHVTSPSAGQRKPQPLKPPTQQPPFWACGISDKGCLRAPIALAILGARVGETGAGGPGAKGYTTASSFTMQCLVQHLIHGEAVKFQLKVFRMTACELMLRSSQVCGVLPASLQLLQELLPSFANKCTARKPCRGTNNSDRFGTMSNHALDAHGLCKLAWHQTSSSSLKAKGCVSS